MSFKTGFYPTENLKIKDKGLKMFNKYRNLIITQRLLFIPTVYYTSLQKKSTPPK